MLWAFKVAKSDEKIMGSLSAELKPRKAMENPHVRGVLLHSYKSSLLGGSHGTTAVAHQVCVDSLLCVYAHSICVSMLCVL